MIEVLRGWGRRRWLVASLAGVGSGLLIALVTAMIDNPVFARSVPTPWWAWPTLAASALLSGLLIATYVRRPGVVEPERVSRTGSVGGLLTVFAVGCPVCNKLALLALGSAGAMQWFAPVQPVLAVLALGLLGWGLVVRLRGEIACPVPQPRWGGSPRTSGARETTQSGSHGEQQAG